MAQLRQQGWCVAGACAVPSSLWVPAEDAAAAAASALTWCGCWGSTGVLHTCSPKLYPACHAAGCTTWRGTRWPASSHAATFGAGSFSVLLVCVDVQHALHIPVAD